MVVKSESYPGAGYQQQTYMMVRESDGYSQNGYYNGHDHSHKDYPQSHMPVFQQGPNEQKHNSEWGHNEQKHHSRWETSPGYGNGYYDSTPSSTEYSGAIPLSEVYAKYYQGSKHGQKHHSRWGHSEQKHHSGWETSPGYGKGYDNSTPSSTKYSGAILLSEGYANHYQGSKHGQKPHSRWGHSEQKHHSGWETSPGYGKSYYNSTPSSTEYSGEIPLSEGYANHYHSGWGNGHLGYSHGNCDKHGHGGNKKTWTLEEIEDDE